MKKIKLDLDRLEVESFQTTPQMEARPAGTVQGYDLFEEIAKRTLAQAECLSGFNSCQTCIDPSCPGTCISCETCDCPTEGCTLACPSTVICE